MIISRTPLRASFCGGGSDLPAFYREYGGAVLSMSIARYVYLSMHEYFQRTIDDNSQRMQENFQRQMANKDWQQQQELNYINDEKEYQDPNGGNIDLPMNYKYHYSDPQGDIYCTNDPDDLPPGAQPLNPTPAP